MRKIAKLVQRPALAIGAVCLGLVLGACGSSGGHGDHAAPSSTATAASRAPVDANRGTVRPSITPTTHKPTETVSQHAAVQSAKSYLEMGGFSKAGLIDQLDSTAGAGFSKADATYAVNHVTVNWNKQALDSAKSYMEMGGFSRAALLDQLTSSAGGQFTQAQAEYAVNHVGL